ncbi:WYL domain-containing protein [Alicyclobacillus curvatus]|nr:WYL domain-containing protein [Alicyclobacillus curvatus]
MRADRLLMELGLLQTEDKVTAERMAEKLGVSIRTIYRDIESLCMAGIPVVAEPGQYGGYSLPSGYKANITGLMSTDIYPLVLRQLGSAFRDLRMRSVDDAVTKILGNVPDWQKNRLLLLRERFMVDQVGWFSDETPIGLFSSIESAVMNNQPLHAVYEDAGGKTREYVLQPYGMVYKAGVWYLVAYDNNRFKSYRLSRFLDVSVMEALFERQPDFVLHQFWENSVREYQSLNECVEVRFLVDTDFLHKLPQFLGEGARKTVHSAVPHHASGWYLMDWTFESVNTMVSQILSMGHYVQITEPAWAVSLISEIVAKTARLYENSG